MLVLLRYDLMNSSRRDAVTAVIDIRVCLLLYIIR